MAAIAGIDSLISNYKVQQPRSESITDGNKSSNTVSFSDYLNQAFNDVNQLQIDSEQISVDFAAGKTDNIHQVTIAAEKAEVALQLTVQVRNKIMEAYTEIMRMQI
ncbi:MAG: flagellar hook-basal body complex protein FliE [Clostridiaceae bacterium]|nr:flagellar hook-basal body complex protein FliE [Clostridiaceae bacterium]